MTEPTTSESPLSHIEGLIAGIKEYLKELIDQHESRLNAIDSPKNGALKQMWDRIAKSEQDLNDRIVKQGRWITRLAIATLASALISLTILLAQTGGVRNATQNGGPKAMGPRARSERLWAERDSRPASASGRAYAGQTQPQNDRDTLRPAR